MAHHAWPFRRLSQRHPYRGCSCAPLGMVSGALAQALLNTQTIEHHLGDACDHRILGRFGLSILGGFGATVHVGFMEINTMKNKLLALGLGGTVLAILCCFTPLLPIVLTALGMTGLLSVLYNDAVLLPILAGFLLLTGYALWRQKKQK